MRYLIADGSTNSNDIANYKSLILSNNFFRTHCLYVVIRSAIDTHIGRIRRYIVNNVSCTSVWAHINIMLYGTQIDGMNTNLRIIMAQNWPIISFFIALPIHRRPLQPYERAHACVCSVSVSTCLDRITYSCFIFKHKSNKYPFYVRFGSFLRQNIETNILYLIILFMQTRASSRARQAASMRLKMANRAAQRKHEFTFSFAHTHTWDDVGNRI